MKYQLYGSKSKDKNEKLSCIYICDSFSRAVNLEPVFRKMGYVRLIAFGVE